MTLTLSKEDEALYDRQIRLWGREAQQKIREGAVVIGGNFTGVAHELVKNLILKGIGKTVLLTWSQDDTIEFDINSILFKSNVTSPSNQTMADIIIEQAKEMNPSVELSHLHLPTWLAVDNYLMGNMTSMMVLVNNESYDIAKSLDETCRGRGIVFQWILTNGMMAILINDFGSVHHYTEELRKTANNEVISQTEHRTISFPSVRDLWIKHLDNGKTWTTPNRKRNALPCKYSPQFAEYQKTIEKGHFLDGHVEMPPVNAIIGAISAQEIVKAITKKDLPIHNIVLFDGASLDSTIISIDYNKDE